MDDLRGREKEFEKVGGMLEKAQRTCNRSGQIERFRYRTRAIQRNSRRRYA